MSISEAGASPRQLQVRVSVATDFEDDDVRSARAREDGHEVEAAPGAGDDRATGRPLRKGETTDAGGLSFPGLLFAIVVTALGSPMLSLPSTAREVGPWLAVGLLLVAAVMNSEIARLIARTCDVLEELPQKLCCTSSPGLAAGAATPLLQAYDANEDTEKEGGDDHNDDNDLLEEDEGEAVVKVNVSSEIAAVDVEVRKQPGCMSKSEHLADPSRPEETGDEKDKTNTGITTRRPLPALHTITITNYAGYLQACFRDRPLLRRVASVVQFIGYFALFVIGDIVFGASLLQLNPTLERSLGEQKARFVLSVCVLLPYHFMQTFTTESFRDFVTKWLASAVPFVFAVITATIVLGLRNQSTHERRQITDYYSEDAPEGAVEAHVINRSTRSTSGDEFFSAWHDWTFPARIDLDGLTLIRIAAVQFYAFMAASLTPSLRNRSRITMRSRSASSMVGTTTSSHVEGQQEVQKQSDVGQAFFAATGLCTLVFSAIVMYAYHVCGNSVPDFITDAFRSERPERWWLRVKGYSSDPETRRHATSADQCDGVREELAAASLFAQSWPQNKRNGGPEHYAPWTLGEPTTVCFLINLLLLFCQSTTDLLYVSNFFKGCDENFGFINIRGGGSGKPQPHQFDVDGAADVEAGDEGGGGEEGSISLLGYLFRGVIVVSRVFAALTVPYILEVAGLVSSFSLVLTEVLLPLYGYYLWKHSRSRRGGRGGAVTLLVETSLHTLIFIAGMIIFVFASGAGVQRIYTRLAADFAPSQRGARTSPCNGPDEIF
eukprot:g14763.t1